MHLSSRRISWSLLALATFLLPSLAEAHTGTGIHTHGFINGLAHPLLGLDHICAMLAVGLWAVQQAKAKGNENAKMLWLLPLTFVSVMALGGALGMRGMVLPFAEEGVLLSVLVLGVLVAAAIRLPLAASVLVVGTFALFHGHAHGAEMPQDASGLTYGLGFLVATAFLHGSGIALAAAVTRQGHERLVRLAGAAIVLCGLGFWLA